MGGTFNPIHQGHLALAKAAWHQFYLDEIIFIPTGTPPHKALGKVIDKEHRFSMVKLAIRKNKKFKASRLEIDRQGVSFAVDTFHQLREKFGPKVKLFFIMGLDSINEILEWKKPLELFKLCEFIVGTRPGAKPRTFRRMLKFPPLKDQINKIYLMELNENISASEIRERLKTGKSAAKLIPRAVLAYIKQNKLYE